MFTNPQDYLKSYADILLTIPKTPDEVKEVLNKTKNVVDIETNNVKKVISVYNRSTTGKASVNEMYEANGLAKDLLVTARFAAIMTIPGTLLALPILSKIADEYDFEFIPKSVKKEFAI